MGRVQWLLVPPLVFGWATSALCQSAVEAPTQSINWPPYGQPSSYLPDAGADSSTDAVMLGMQNVNDTGNGNDANLTGSGVFSGNPAATDLQVGSGRLGDWLGVNHNGFRLGGINISDVNAQVTGGVEPGSWTTDSLTILDMSLDMEKWMSWKGGRLGMELLFYSGGDIDGDAGSVMGYNSLDGVAPRTRFEIYTLWFRQYFCEEAISVRVGKLVPTYDFNNVARSIPFEDDAYNIPGVSSAILVPLYLSPTLLGIMPGYYNSATGMVAVLSPSDHCYVQYGLYDGNLAAGRQTGLVGPHFNGYYLHVAECGADWTLGRQEKPGAIGAGYWNQTGLLSAPGGNVEGAQGVYLFASQRLYFERPGKSNNGLTAWLQLAGTNSDFVSTHRYVGAGLTYFGPIPCRDNDSAGFAFAYGKMNTDPAANLGRQEAIYTWYYQYQVNQNFALQPNLTYISTPATGPGLSDVFAITFRVIVAF